jgi:predicted alpha/beta hydrolase family esterase
MEYVIGLFFGIVGSLVAAELYCWAPHIARKFIERAVLRLPESEQDRLREEWFAHLDECPGSLAKLCHSLGCFQCAAAIAATAPKVAAVSPNKTRTIDVMIQKSLAMRVTKDKIVKLSSNLAWWSILFGGLIVIIGIKTTLDLLGSGIH